MIPMFLLWELLVSLGTSEYHIDPYPHGLGGRRHKVVSPIVSFNAECQFGHWAFHCSHVIDVNVDDRLEIYAASRLRLRFIRVVNERALVSVEHEPAFVPRLEFAAHFLEDSPTGGRVQCDVLTLVYVVTCRLYVLFQVNLFTAFHW